MIDGERKRHPEVGWYAGQNIDWESIALALLDDMVDWTGWDSIALENHLKSLIKKYSGPRVRRATEDRREPGSVCGVCLKPIHYPHNC